MVLKPQDVLVATKAALLGGDRRFVFSEVASALALSRSEVHAAVGRCLNAKLMNRDPHRVDAAAVANRTNLIEFLLHGARYAFPATHGGVTRGMPTAHAAPVLSGHFATTSSLPPVWPDPAGRVRGRAFEPLYRSVPVAASKDPQLYAVLALIDALRGGSARDREVAQQLLPRFLAPGSGHANELEPRHA